MKNIKVFFSKKIHFFGGKIFSIFERHDFVMGFEVISHQNTDCAGGLLVSELRLENYPLRKHACSNILKILPPKHENF